MLKNSARNCSMNANRLKNVHSHFVVFSALSVMAGWASQGDTDEQELQRDAVRAPTE